VIRIEGAKGSRWNNAATQPPLADVHKPTVAQPVRDFEPVAGVHVPCNYRTVPTVHGSSTVPPPLPPRNQPTTEDSPYVMMYPLQPPRSQPAAVVSPTK